MDNRNGDCCCRQEAITNYKTCADIKKKIVGLTNMTEFSAEDLVDCACRMGHLLKTDLKTSQLRKFLSAVSEIRTKVTMDKDFEKSQLILLLPQLAYAAARQDAVKPLYEVIEPAIRRVTEKKGANNLFKFIEAIVAYHKYHGGKEK